MIVRTAASGDADLLAQLAKETGVALFEVGDSSIVVVAELEGVFSGFAVVSSVAGESELLAIAVRETMRRRGVARALLREAIERARTRGAAVMFLEVRASNTAARAFYSREGFEESGLRRGYYSDGEDAVLMRRGISVIPSR